MEIEYRHNFKGNYVVMKNPNIIVNDYRLHMLLKNDIDGFLRFCVSCVDGAIELSYLISSKQSIKEMSERQKLGYEELSSIIKGIIHIADKAHRYLLKIDDIILEPELLYMDYEGKGVWFCYYPNSKNDFYSKFKNLIQELMIVTEHGDRSAVELIYGIYNICQRTSFLVDDIEMFINKFSKKDFYETVNRENNYQVSQSDRSFCMDMVCENIEEKKGEVSENQFKSVLKNSKFIDKISKVFKFSPKSGVRKDFIKTYDNKGCKDIPYKNIEELDYCSDNLITNNECGFQVKSNETVLLADCSTDRKKLLFSISGQKNIEIDTVPFVIGKLKEKTNYIIDDKSVSRIHLRIDIDEKDNYYIEDMNSKNGTFVNGIRLEPYEKKLIVMGDSIKISVYEYIFR